MKTEQFSTATNRHNNQGFTLIETLMALFLFSFGIIAVMTMTTTSMTAFTNARATTTEINRSSLNLEALKHVGYGNNQIFTGAQVVPTGTDGTTVGYNDTNDAVVMETKLIVLQNNAINHGTSPSGLYELYFTKPFIE